MCDQWVLYQKQPLRSSYPSLTCQKKYNVQVVISPNVFCYSLFTEFACLIKIQWDTSCKPIALKVHVFVFLLHLHIRYHSIVRLPSLKWPCKVYMLHNVLHDFRITHRFIYARKGIQQVLHHRFTHAAKCI